MFSVVHIRMLIFFLSKCKNLFIVGKGYEIVFFLTQISLVFIFLSVPYVRTGK